MNWEAVGAISEGIGALAVVITILYLSKQMKQNSQSTRMNAYQLLLEHVTNINHTMISNPEVREVVNKFSDPAYQASVHELETMRIVMISAMRHWSHAFDMYRQGTITESQWKTFEAGLKRTIDRGMLQRDVDQLMEGYSGEFADFVYTSIKSSSFQLPDQTQAPD